MASARRAANRSAPRQHLLVQCRVPLHHPREGSIPRRPFGAHASPIFAASFEDPITSTTPFASPAGSAVGTRIPDTPSSTMVSGPPERVTTTGSPVASACTVASENPSSLEERTKTSSALRMSGTSPRNPRKWTCSSRPSDRRRLQQILVQPGRGAGARCQPPPLREGFPHQRKRVQEIVVGLRRTDVADRSDQDAPLRNAKLAPKGLVSTRGEDVAVDAVGDHLDAIGGQRRGARQNRIAGVPRRTPAYSSAFPARGELGAVRALMRGWMSAMPWKLLTTGMRAPREAERPVDGRREQVGLDEVRLLPHGEPPEGHGVRHVEGPPRGNDKRAEPLAPKRLGEPAVHRHDGNGVPGGLGTGRSRGAGRWSRPRRDRRCR